MSAMEGKPDAPQSASIVEEHLDGLFRELKMACEKASPLKLAKRHPVMAAGAAGLTGLFAARWLFGGRRRAKKEEAREKESGGLGRFLLAQLIPHAVQHAPALFTLLRDKFRGRPPEEPWTADLSRDVTAPREGSPEDKAPSAS